MLFGKLSYLKILIYITIFGIIQFIIYQKIIKNNIELTVDIKSYNRKDVINYNHQGLKGINPQDIYLYAQYMGVSQDKHNNFICFSSGKNIPLKYLNDDYCDCEDGSDEPSTSACRGNKFFCDYQLPLLNDKNIFHVNFVYSTQVDDGICDCCDGSDEWSDKIQCKNTCDNLLNHFKFEENEKLRGRRIKQLYIKQAIINHISPDLYGVKNEYYHLKKKCIKYKFYQYEYHICPFKESKQIKLLPDGEKSVLNIGKKSIWLKPNQILIYDGDSSTCPNINKMFQNITIIGRHSILNFKCGSEDKILTLTENEPCFYTFNILTPAAC
ncbi:uncharacterized protein LOC135922069 isoform X2 [Gordionus sp. m RMFG-2023]|uniref:uncharacterized protein LOC135922069 isoform X2 n=1 Tax=Gordionus sp. m RMFG-2023 TaxID=3053472 RepID=UPI0031FBD124